MAFGLMTWRSAAIVALAALCTAVAATRMPLGFERTRVRVVTSPTSPTDRSLDVPLPDLSPFENTPTAFILRVRGGRTPSQVAARFDGTEIAAASVAAGGTVRIDAAAVPAGGGHRITISGSNDDWQLTYLEVANVHGFSNGLLAVEVVPAAQRGFDTLPWFAAAFIFLALLALRSQPGWPRTRAARIAYWSAGGLVLTIFLAALLGDRLSPFKILVRPQTFWLGIAILYAQRTLHVLRELAHWSLVLLSGLLAVWRWIVYGISTAAATRGACAALAGTAAIAVVATAMALGSNVAGGADSYGYLSQAELWASGRLYIDQPLARQLPDDIADAVLTPLGYAGQADSGVRGRIVPSYSPGLPLMMAPFRAIGGREAVFVVVPLLAGLTVWLTFVLGRRLDGDATGLLAAVWLAASPAFVSAALNPMSDVPAAALWMVGLVASLGTSPAAAATAGIGCALAVLIRPNLVPLAAIVGLPFVVRWIAGGRSRAETGRLALFAVTTAIGPLLIAVLFNYWFGSPFTSGYGSTGSLFDMAYLAANLDRYPAWLLSTQTPLVLAAFAAPLLWRRRGGRSRALACLLLLFAAGVWLLYLGYFFFDHWTYLRFMLPSYPPLLVLAASTLIYACRRTAAPRLLATVLALLMVAHGGLRLKRDRILNVANSEARYPDAAALAERTLPEGAVLLSMQHSGSLRYYSRFVSMRYDFLPDDRLDDMIDRLRRSGRPVYIVLDDWEIKDFQRRFAGRSAIGRLDWPPVATRPGSPAVVIYDPAGR